MALKQKIKEIKGLYDGKNTLIQFVWRVCNAETFLQNSLTKIRDITVSTVSQLADLGRLEMTA